MEAGLSGTLDTGVAQLRAMKRKIIFVYPTHPATGGGRIERFVRHIGTYGFELLSSI